MIDQYKYTWKMVKPLIPIIFLAIWVVLFEDKIWPDWENEIPFNEIIDYYFDFMWYFGNLLFPILLFLSIIWFTSKLANNTEIISILSSGVSFSRFLRPGTLQNLIFRTGSSFAPIGNSGDRYRTDFVPILMMIYHIIMMHYHDASS